MSEKKSSKTAKNIKKRQYSRNGCQECKRRKLKCDEAKPDCWQCSHLGKKCEYTKRIRFSDSRTIIVPSEKILSPEGSTRTQIVTFESTPASAAETLNGQNQYKPNTEDDIVHDASHLAHDIIESLNSEVDDFINDLTLSNIVKKKNVIDSFGLQDPHRQYLEVFYDKISAWILPLDQNFCNDILLLHARSSPYLLAAILSLSTPTEVEKNKYINTCLRSLSSVFQSDQASILNNIEPLILTILLLATESGSSNWKLHLRGAKDLFIKYMRVNQTPSLLLAKSWFAAIEILATLQSTGTAKDDNELDELLDVGLYSSSAEMAIECGLLFDNGFNLFLGYSSESIIMYREWCKLVKNGITNDKLLFQMSLVHSAKEFQVASSKIVIDRSNKAHPEYENVNEKTVLPVSCYGFTSDGVVYSWFDLTHQMHVDALFLQIYVQVFGFKSDHVLVQGLVKQMLGICLFFENNEIGDTQDARLLLIQSAMLTCGMCSVDGEDRLKIQKYFDCLVNLGIKSAPTSVKKVQDYWDGNHSNSVSDFVTFA